MVTCDPIQYATCVDWLAGVTARDFGFKNNADASFHDMADERLKELELEMNSNPLGGNDELDPEGPLSPVHPIPWFKKNQSYNEVSGPGGVSPSRAPNPLDKQIVDDFLN